MPSLPRQPNSQPPPERGATPDLQLLIESEPCWDSFSSSVGELLSSSGPSITSLRLVGKGNPFGSTVFVERAIPWSRLAQSAFFHILLLIVVVALSQVQPHASQQFSGKFLEKSQVIYYSASEYLPPLNQKSRPARSAQKGSPGHARQEVISVPAEVDNRSQTVITPPRVKLTADVPLPNLVAWTPVPSPVPVTGSMRANVNVQVLPTSVVAPPPELERLTRPAHALAQSPVIAPPPDPSLTLSTHHPLQTPAVAVVEPPPSTTVVPRNPGTMNVADLQPSVLAPKLPVPAQQSLGGTFQPIATPMAPPDVRGLARSGGGQIIALGLHPVEPTGPIDLPSGNRHGNFATAPEGQPGPVASPRMVAGGASSGGGGTGMASDDGPGLTVTPGPVRAGDAAGKAVHPSMAATLPGRSGLIAAAMLPLHIRHLPPREVNPAGSPLPDVPELEKKIFGLKRFYSVILSMPNLNSKWGSWIMRFAELNDNGTGGELTAPVATEKVDPAYPGNLIRQQVEGTVTLFAIIRSDGSVADVRVLRGVDDRLDQYARIALSHCRFMPARKNGAAVDLEAVVRIPFRSRKVGY